MSDGLMRPYQSELSLLQRLVDAGLICVVLWISHRLYGVIIDEQNIFSAVLAVVCFYLFAQHSGKLKPCPPDYCPRQRWQRW